MTNAKTLIVVFFCAFASVVLAESWMVITTYSDNTCATPVAISARYYPFCGVKRSTEAVTGDCSLDSASGAYYMLQYTCASLTPSLADYPVKIGYFDSNDCTPADSGTYIFAFMDVNFNGIFVAPDDTFTAYEATLTCASSGTLTFQSCVSSNCQQEEIAAAVCSNPIDGSSFYQSGCSAVPMDAPVAEPVTEPVTAPAGPVAGTPSASPVAAPVRTPAKASSAVALCAQLSTIVLAALML